MVVSPWYLSPHFVHSENFVQDEAMPHTCRIITAHLFRFYWPQNTRETLRIRWTSYFDEAVTVFCKSFSYFLGPWDWYAGCSTNLLKDVCAKHLSYGIELFGWVSFGTILCHNGLFFILTSRKAKERNKWKTFTWRKSWNAVTQS